MKNLAFIPARGGSKEIPGKNIAPLWGKPLIYYTIKAAKMAMCVDMVVVSTDDLRVAEWAAAEGARVIDRPAVISGDHAQIEQAIRHALTLLPSFENIILLQPTSPLRRWYDIDRAMFFFEETGADSLFSASPIQPYVWDHADEGLVRVRFAVTEPRQNRQEMRPLLDENGSIYIFNAKGMLAHERRLFGHIESYHMPPELAVQIDKPTDLVIARALLDHWKDRLIT